MRKGLSSLSTLLLLLASRQQRAKPIKIMIPDRVAAKIIVFCLLSSLLGGEGTGAFVIG